MLSPELDDNEIPAPTLCHYRNETDQMQFLQVFEGETRNLEKVVFPGEIWLFNTHAQAVLHIQTKTVNGVLTQITICDRYQVKQP